jgi:3-hydroxy-9,10-secoandrosta-1,3,5(10)-triene-9,17-dione monooxygenase
MVTLNPDGVAVESGYAPPRPLGTADEREERMVGRARELIPLLAAHARETDAERRVAQPVIDALVGAGLLSITVPRRYGGGEVSLETKIRVAAELARGCGSTGWVASLINVCNWFTALYPERAQDDVWKTDPAARVAGVFAPSGPAAAAPGGYRVSGEWGWASGCLHAQWAVIGIPMVDEAGQTLDLGLALVPMSELTIKDTWFTVGMRGTGSNTLVAEDIFVPAYRVLSFSKAFEGDYPTEHKEEAAYRAAFMPYATTILIGPQLGLARAAFDLVLEKSFRRGVNYTVYEKQVDAPFFRLNLAEAAMHLDSAHLHAFRTAHDVDRDADASRYPDYLTRARMRMGASWAIKEAREAMRILVSAHGASSFAESSPLQRFWRDCEVASRHAVGVPEVNQDIYGSALVGLRHNVSQLI